MVAGVKKLRIMTASMPNAYGLVFNVRSAFLNRGEAVGADHDR
jgi:hypothetical protein